MVKVSWGSWKRVKGEGWECVRRQGDYALRASTSPSLMLKRARAHGFVQGFTVKMPRAHGGNKCGVHG
eukprot:3319162-Rhodomonas_salina.1